ncbi:MAG: putative lipopolysaccharide heptosyltransferase III, partial [Thermodesulfobacteriota bacterium]|nr:putative lipopolysaccharide heptosyltransferase III [Thermodesulfobacteriota bacterium]
ASMADIQWNTARTKNILVIKMRHIGDTVLVTPLLHTLKQAMPRTRLHLLINQQTAAIVKGHPHIHSLIVFDYDRAKRDLPYFFKFLLNIRRLGCDIVMDLTRNDRSALFTFVSGAAVRIGYQGRSFFLQKAYTHCLPYRFDSRHTVDHNLEMAVALGLPITDIHPYLTVSDVNRQRIRHVLLENGSRPGLPIVIMHPGARRWYKSWPLERFSRTADVLMTRYPVQVVLSGGPEDRQACQRIASGMTQPVIDLCDKVPLELLPALMGESILFLGNDAAPIHVATAVNTPVIALFGPTRWEDWQPRRDHDKTLGIAFPCRPCGHSRPDCPLGDGYCMSEITEEMVCQAIEERFEAIGLKKTSNCSVRH